MKEGHGELKSPHTNKLNGEPCPPAESIIKDWDDGTSWKIVWPNGTVPIHYYFHSPRVWILDDDGGAELLLMIEAIARDSFTISCRRVWEARASYMIAKRNEIIHMVNELLNQMGYIVDWRSK